MAEETRGKLKIRQSRDKEAVGKAQEWTETKKNPDYDLSKGAREMRS